MLQNILISVCDNFDLVKLLQEGYVACRSHIASNALKTNCPMAECVRIAKELSSAE